MTKAFNILRFPKLDSTNTYAMRHLEELHDRQVILADRQTAGYGRFKRRWLSDAPGNIFMSIVLKPNPELAENSPIANLTQHLSLVLCKVLEDYQVNAAIKWPNDVLVEGKKIAGILSETSIRGSQLNGIVMGVGINLNMTEKAVQSIDQPATALNLVTGEIPDREAFLQNLLEKYFRDYEYLLREGFNLIRSEYEQRCRFLGKQIKVSMQGRQLTGMASGFNDYGNLILKTDSETAIITAGDVTFQLFNISHNEIKSFD